MLAFIESPTDAWSGPADHVFLNALSCKSAARRFFGPAARAGVVLLARGAAALSCAEVENMKTVVELNEAVIHFTAIASSRSAVMLNYLALA